jgi:ribosome-associated protein
MNVIISWEYIELSKLLKHLGRVDSGWEAKLAISGGLVFVNGEEELRIRRKCIAGDVVEFEWEKVVIK